MSSCSYHMCDSLADSLLLSGPKEDPSPCRLFPSLLPAAPQYCPPQLHTGTHGCTCIPGFDCLLLPPPPPRDHLTLSCGMPLGLQMRLLSSLWIFFRLNLSYSPQCTSFLESMPWPQSLVAASSASLCPSHMFFNCVYVLLCLTDL